MNVRDLVPWLTDSRFRASDPLALFQARVNTLFDEAYAPLRSCSTESRASAPFADFAPRVNVTESDDACTVTAELPGIDVKDVTVTVKERILTISGERKNAIDKKDSKGASYTESSFGTFRRALRIGTDIEEDKVQASMKNGLLVVTLPKSSPERQAGRTIAITSE